MKKAIVLDGYSRLEAGTIVEILKYSESMNEYYCKTENGQTCYWIKAELLEVIE